MRLFQWSWVLLLVLLQHAACDIKRPNSTETVSFGLALKLSLSDVVLQPGGSVGVTLKISTDTALREPVRCSVRADTQDDLPTGLSSSFDPPEFEVQTGQPVQATMRLSADPTIVISEYGLVVEVRSGEKFAKMPLLVRIAQVGPQWQRQLGTKGTDTLVAMAADSQGNVYLALNSTDSVDGKTNLGDYDGYLLSYSPTGVLRFVTQIASTKTDFLTGLTIDKYDSVYVSGYTFGTLPDQTSSGRTDGFVAKFSPAGQKEWLKQLGTSEIDKLQGVGVGAEGEVVAIGSTEGNYGTFTNAGLSDVWVVRFDSSGNQTWAFQTGSDQNDSANAVAVQPVGDVAYVTGVAGGVLPTGSTLGLQDGFLLSLGKDGKLGWLRHVGTSGTDELFSIALDDAGGIFLSGSTRGTLPGQIGMGGQDGMLLKYAADGTRTFARQLGTSYVDSIQTIAWIDGALYSVGSTKGAFPGQSAAGGYDFFFAKHRTDGGFSWLNQVGTDQADNSAGLAGKGNMLYVGATTFGVFDSMTGLGDSDAYILALKMY